VVIVFEHQSQPYNWKEFQRALTQKHFTNYIFIYLLFRYFANGVCKFGSACKYSHDRSDPLDMVCRYYQFGKCAYGEKCRFVLWDC